MCVCSCATITGRLSIGRTLSRSNFASSSSGVVAVPP
jgi:hypothetical protein